MGGFRLQELDICFQKLKRHYYKIRYGYLKNHSREDFVEHQLEVMLENPKMSELLHQFVTSFGPQGVSEWFLLNAIHSEELQSLILQYCDFSETPILDEANASAYPRYWNQQGNYKFTCFSSLDPKQDEMEQLLLQNLKLVNYAFGVLIPKYLLEKASYEEIYHFAMIGLWNALQTYDKTRGASFFTYANKCIYYSIIRELGKENEFMGTGSYEKFIEYQSFCKKYEEKKGCLPSQEEISLELGITPSKVEQFENLSISPVSLDEIDIKEEAQEDLEQIYLKKERRLEVHEVLRELDAYSQEIIRRRYLSFEPVSLQKIGEEHNITKEAVRLQEKKALKQLRKKLK